MKNKTKGVWHVVVGKFGGLVLGVYGAALISDAESSAPVKHGVGMIVTLRDVVRPSVGDVLEEGAI